MKYQLLLRAEKLPTRGVLKRRPSTFAVVSNLSEIGSVLGIKRHRLGRTETVPLSLSPEWACVILLEHTPGDEHRIAVDIFHTDNETQTGLSVNTGVSNDEQMYDPRGVPITEENTIQLCGNIFDVETILSDKDQTITEKIPGCDGSIHVRLEKCIEISAPKAIRFQLRGYRLTNTRLNLLNLDRPDFYFEIHRKQEGRTQNTWALVYRSHCVRLSLNPLWAEATVDLLSLCNNDSDRELRISILDIDAFGKRTYLGSCDTSVRGLIEARALRGNCDRDKAFRLARIRDMKRKEKRGELIVVIAELINLNFTMSSPQPRAEEPIAVAVPAEPVVVQILEPPTSPQQRSSVVRTQYSFDDFVSRGGCGIEMCVAIDFSAANGDYLELGTPHYRYDDRHNDYQWAINVVAATLRRFNSTQQYPVWGFAASFGGETCNIFQCGRAARADGVQGLLDGYETVFQTGLVFQNQINYSEVIRASASYSKKAMNKAQQNRRLSYTLLLVLTTGSESDIRAAKKDIELASNAPLSILFLRIDNGKHRDTWIDSKLDVVLTNNGCRSLCSFVECKRFSNPRNAQGLSQAVMHNLTHQLETYFSSQGIAPVNTSF